jgi:hypothetical protein
VDAGTVRKLVEGMTPKTWRHLRDELLALVTATLSPSPQQNNRVGQFSG